MRSYVRAIADILEGGLFQFVAVDAAVAEHAFGWADEPGSHTANTFAV